MKLQEEKLQATQEAEQKTTEKLQVRSHVTLCTVAYRPGGVSTQSLRVNPGAGPRKGINLGKDIFGS